jgi:methyl-accepting chemotaxis protein
LRKGKIAVLKNMKIRTKLFAGFALVLLLAVIVGGLAITKMLTITRGATQLSEQVLPSVVTANEVERSLQTAMLAMRTYGLTGEEKHLKDTRENLHLVNGALTKSRELAGKYNMASLRDATSKAQDGVDGYTRIVEQTAAIQAKMVACRKALNDSAQTLVKACHEYLEDEQTKFDREAHANTAPDKLIERNQKLGRLNEVIDLSNSLRIATSTAQALRDPKVIQDAIPTFDKIDSIIAGIRKETTQQINLDQLDAITAASKAYKAQMAGLMDAWSENDKCGVERTLIADSVLDQAKNMAINGTTGANDTAKESVSSLKTASVTVIVGLSIAVLVGIGLAFFITRSIVTPVHDIVARIQEIAKGDLTLRTKADGKDEIAEMGTCFNGFVQKLHDAITEVSGSSHEVASAATEIAASSEEMASGMKEQATQVTQISSAIEQMSSSVVEVAKKSAEAANNAADSGKTAQEGGKVVTQTIEGMQSISQAVSASATAVQELGKRGEQIGQIIKVINDIADQTNLLALNAAIEAARAGEHGRGFAVVADEVRKLADRTTKATEEIAQSINAIQTETGEAVKRMNAGTEQVKVGVERATEAGDSLGKIVAGAQQVATMIQSIAAAAEQQSAAAEQVSRNVESISAVTKQATEGAGQAAAAASQLSTKAEQLQKLVSQFKISSEHKKLAA